ncbi:MAG: glycosyltransferase [Pseudomonadota bacterium]
MRNTGPTVIGGDLGCLRGEGGLENQVSLYAEALKRLPDYSVSLAYRRTRQDVFSIQNAIEKLGLTDRFRIYPYYTFCERYPLKKTDCDFWLDGTESKFSDVLDPERSATKTALFMTSFHPLKQEGNSRLMRDWIRRMRESGYRVHVLYYRYDHNVVHEALRHAARREYDNYVEVDVETPLVGRNQDGLNVNVDDWCGPEYLDAVEELCQEFAYDIALVNYPFMTAAFERVPAYTKKLFLTHDSFIDRNRRMLAQGYPNAGWVSIDREGEALACQRSDSVIALQEGEAETFRELAGEDADVRLIPPIFEPVECNSSPSRGKLRIGYFGSRNWVNEQNFAEYMKEWLKYPELVEQSELVVGGGVCDHLSDFLSDKNAKHPALKLLGRVDDLFDFFAQCDIVINPERGGTGIKIKSLETMAYGRPLLATIAGAVGLGSSSRFHQAAGFAEIAALTAELVRDPSLVEKLKSETKATYDAYRARHEAAMVSLLGPKIEAKASIPTTPRVSIVIPFYNVEAFIGECLESVARQSYSDLEVILVDDVSPDGSRAIAEEFCRNHRNFKLVTHKVNQGLGPARNTGVQHATGRYITFLDSDDRFSSSSAIKKLVSIAENTNCQVVAGSARRLKPDGSLEPFDEVAEKERATTTSDRLQGDDAYKAVIGSGDSYLPMRAWGYLIDSALCRQSGLEFPAKPHEDMPYVPVLCAQANFVVYSREVCVDYRERAGGISTTRMSTEKLVEMGGLWQFTKEINGRFELERHNGDAALASLAHLAWRCATNGIHDSDRTFLIDEFKRQIADATQVSNTEFLVRTHKSLRWALHELDFTGTDRRDIMDCLPVETFIQLHQGELGLMETKS